MTGWPTAARPARRSAFRPSAVFVGLVALCATGGVLAWFDFGNANVDVIVFVVAGWLVSLSLHEYAHALFAYQRGDRSVVADGLPDPEPAEVHPPGAVDRCCRWCSC